MVDQAKDQNAVCRLLVGLSGVLPGWGCCKCSIYNGLQRKTCKRCGHVPCITLPKPSEHGLCDECGVPEGASHVGH